MSENSIEVAKIKAGAATLRVVSHCGVVQLHSDRDGCLVALNPTEAVAVAEALADALWDAAEMTDRRSRGLAVRENDKEEKR